MGAHCTKRATRLYANCYKYLILLVDEKNPKPNPIYIINQNNTSQLDNDPGCFYEGDKRYYKIGTSWHPYVPPFGYSKCAICTCTVSYGKCYAFNLH